MHWGINNSMIIAFLQFASIIFTVAFVDFVVKFDKLLCNDLNYSE